MGETSEHPAIYAALTEIFNDVFLRDDMALNPSLNAADVPGWDSFKQIEIMVLVEERFSIKLTTKEIDGLASVGDLANTIARKTGG